MHIVPGFIVREIAGDTVAIPCGAAAAKLSGLIALNGSGKFLFDLLQTEQTEQSLLDAMLETFDIDENTAMCDINEFLNTLREASVIIED